MHKSLHSKSTKLKRLFKFVVITTLSTSLVALLPTPAKANGIFSPALNAMTCIINSAGTGGATNALITKLPAVIFGVITFFIFAYILISLNQIFQAVRNGEEITNLVIPCLSSFLGLLVIMVFQNMLFGSGGC